MTAAREASAHLLHRGEIKGSGAWLAGLCMIVSVAVRRIGKFGGPAVPAEEARTLEAGLPRKPAAGQARGVSAAHGVARLLIPAPVHLSCTHLHTPNPAGRRM